MQTLVFAAEEDPGNVLMIELRGGAGFLMEAADNLRIARHVGGQNLERDGAVELRIAGSNHRRHAPHAERAEQLEMCQAPAAQDVGEGFFGADGRQRRARDHGRRIIRGIHFAGGKQIAGSQFDDVG